MKRTLFEALPCRALPLAAALLLTVACSPSDTATNAPQADGAGEPAASTPGVGEAGLRAYIDPETGELTSRPVDGTDLQSSADPLNFSSEGLTQKVRPDGAVGVDLQGRFMNSSYAVRQPDGSVKIQYTPPTGSAEAQPSAELTHAPSKEEATEEDAR